MENIVIMLITFMILLFAGVPVVFCLGVPTLIYLVLNTHMPVELMAHSMITPLYTYVLLALPAFLLSGRMMNAAGVTERLLAFSIAAVGRFRGGLAQANALASMLFASMSGTAVGDAGGLGLVAIKIMRAAGYKGGFSAGITAASSILGPIIPPSASMVILGAMAEISIGRLFLSGVVPGLIMTAALMTSVYLRATFTREGKTWPVTVVPTKEALGTFAPAFFPMLTPIIIIGAIVLGISTPTEAAVLAINYALILGLFYKQISFKKLWKTLEDTVVTTGVFMFIISTAGFFTWLLTREGLPQLLTRQLGFLATSGDIAFFLVVALVLLVVGAFMDTTAAILLVTPVLMPIVKMLGIDPVHFGVIMIVALMIGIITPPFGICLFVVSEVSGVSVLKVTKEAVRYIPAMLITLILIIVFPKLVLWLPNLFFGAVGM
jgi:tripartite ATP-independent transporter DctM subunit